MDILSELAKKLNFTIMATSVIDGITKFDGLTPSGRVVTGHRHDGDTHDIFLTGLISSNRTPDGLFHEEDGIYVDDHLHILSVYDQMSNRFVFGLDMVSRMTNMDYLVELMTNSDKKQSESLKRLIDDTIIDIPTWKAAIDRQDTFTLRYRVTYPKINGDMGQSVLYVVPHTTAFPLE